MLLLFSYPGYPYGASLSPVKSEESMGSDKQHPKGIICQPYLPLVFRTAKLKQKILDCYVRAKNKLKKFGQQCLRKNIVQA